MAMQKRLISKKRAFIRRLVAKLHGNFTPPAICRSPTHCLRRFERSDYGDKGVSLSFLCCRRPQSRYACFTAWCWSLVPGWGKSWRTRRVARYRKNVSDLPYAAPPLSCAAFFVKVQIRSDGTGKAERGTLRLSP